MNRSRAIALVAVLAASAAVTVTASGTVTAGAAGEASLVSAVPPPNPNKWTDGPPDFAEIVP